MKVCSQRNHVSVDLHCRDVSGRQVPMAKLDQRATAESDHQNSLGASAEQQKSHHLACVFTDQSDRIIEAHLALRAAIECEAHRPEFEVLHQEGFIVAPVHYPSKYSSA